MKNTYLVGDVHGCYSELRQLLTQVAFNPQQDVLWLTGDLVARGPDSLAVLRFVKSLGASARIVLGNHDLHLLAVYAGISKNKKRDQLTELLHAADADSLIDWLRRQPLLQQDKEKKLLMAHAGISPQWDTATALACARELEAVLASDHYAQFLDNMYGDLPNYWDEQLNGTERWRFSANVFTRMRYCLPNGQLDMICKSPPAKAPPLLKPWFAIPGPVLRDNCIVFGHWAALKGQGTPANVIGLDSGCVWGGALTLYHWETRRYYQQPAIST